MEMIKEFNTKKIKELVLHFSFWEKENLKINHGKREISSADTFGLPYTSSGDYAGLWNTNTESVLRNNHLLGFDGIGYTTDFVPMAIFTRHDEDGNELETVFLPME